MLSFTLETPSSMMLYCYGPRSKNSKFNKCLIKTFLKLFRDKGIGVTSLSHIYVGILSKWEIYLKIVMDRLNHCFSKYGLHASAIVFSSDYDLRILQFF